MNWYCYRCVRDGQPEPVRAERAAEGLTIHDGTLTCLEHVRADQRATEFFREAERQETRARRERSGDSVVTTKPWTAEDSLAEARRAGELMGSGPLAGWVPGRDDPPSWRHEVPPPGGEG